MAVRVVDYSPLTSPVTASDVAAWRKQAKASGAPWASLSVSTLATLVVAGVVGLIFLNLVVGAVATASLNGADAAPAIVMVLIILGIAAIVAVGVRARLGGGGRWARWLRLSRFAQANGMTFSPAQSNPSYPGQIFQLGRDRTALDHLTTASGRFLDLGNFRWVTGSGKSQTTHTWGFVALSLDRNMPNIVLDSKANNTIFGSNLPATLDRRQILHLEGDFDRYFTLYCPAQYEQDALYIFTPDLMALLIDEAAPFDVELVDGWMFVYASHPFAMTDPTVLQRLFTIADTVGAKALDQTERYADARVGDFDANLVARRGARLRRRAPVVAELLGIAFFLGFLVIWGRLFFGQLIDSFSSR